MSNRLSMEHSTYLLQHAENTQMGKMKTTPRGGGFHFALSIVSAQKILGVVLQTGKGVDAV